MDEVSKQLLDLVERRIGRRPDLDTALASLGIDSVELANFIGVLEKQFHIRVDADIVDVETLEELSRYVKAHLQR